MPRDINVTDTSTAGEGANKTGVTYELIDADGETVLSVEAPPWLDQPDTVLYIDQTVTQDAGDDPSATGRFTVAARVTDLAATDAAAPVLTWTAPAGADEVEIHRGSPGFAVDVEGGTTAIATELAAAVATYTDTSVAGDGETEVAYRVVARTAHGWTIGAEAVSTPAAPDIASYEVADDMGGTPGAYVTAREPTWQGGAGEGAWERDPNLGETAIPVLTADGYARGNSANSVVRTTAPVAASGTARARLLRKGSAYNGSLALYLRWTPDVDEGGAAETRYEVQYVPSTGVWQLRKRVEGSFSTLAPDPGTIADAWPVGEHRTMEVEIGPAGITLRAYGDDGTTLIGTKTSTDASITAAGRFGLLSDANATSGLWVDWITYEAAA